MAEKKAKTSAKTSVKKSNESSKKATTSTKKTNTKAKESAKESVKENVKAQKVSEVKSAASKVVVNDSLQNEIEKIRAELNILKQVKNNSEKGSYDRLVQEIEKLKEKIYEIDEKLEELEYQISENEGYWFYWKQFPIKLFNLTKTNLFK